MEQNNPFYLLILVARIICTILCYNQAKSVNRNPISWAIAGFLFPIIATIWVFSLKNIRQPIEISPPKPFIKYYTQNGVIEVETGGEQRVTIDGKPASNGKYELNRFNTIEVVDGRTYVNKI